MRYHGREAAGKQAMLALASDNMSNSTETHRGGGVSIGFTLGTLRVFTTTPGETKKTRIYQTHDKPLSLSRISVSDMKYLVT